MAMKFEIISLGEHLPDPVAGKFLETQSERHRTWVDMGVRAEELGYDAVWLGEHHCCNYIVSSPQMVLASIAARTNIIRLGTAVSLLPTNDPVRLAEDFATLDLLSKGRAEIGFGGGFTDHTFRLFGIDITQSAAVSVENLELIQKLWNEDEIHWTGKFRSPINDSRVEPRTFSGKAIPISRSTATNTETARAAGAAGHKLMCSTASYPYSIMKPLSETYRDSYLKHGHDPSGMNVSEVAFIHVQQNGDKARKYWQSYQANNRVFVKMLVQTKGAPKPLMDFFSNLTPDMAVTRESDICGSPAEVAERIIWADGQVGHMDSLICYFDLGCLPREALMDTMQLFAEEVIPIVRAELDGSSWSKQSPKLEVRSG
jgi:alkanesulfonate monooxygenase SsuD/methylene tetrahydromethanopterin reductase-like flavin-dependent oxidoreductase (luciferase family)